MGKTIGETSQDLILQWHLFHIDTAQLARIWKHRPGDTEIGVPGDDPEFWNEKNASARVVQNTGLCPSGQKTRTFQYKGLGICNNIVLEDCC